MELKDSKIIKAISIFLENPELFFKIVKGKINTKKQPPDSIIEGSINDIHFEFDFTLGPVIKKMYHQCYELNVIEAIRKHLKKGDIFIDVGANIGYVSAFSLGIVGETGQVHSFEPVPEYFERLKKILKLNNISNLFVNQFALSDNEGEDNIHTTCVGNIGWNTMIKDSISQEKFKETIPIKTIRLDNYLLEKNLKPKLIKIDVEGFEFRVLKGLEGYLSKTINPPLIICEIAPETNRLLGYTIKDISDFMGRFSYKSFSTINNERKINLNEITQTQDILFKV